MTLAPVRPIPPRRSTVEPDARLADLLADLGRLELHGRVLLERVAGEQDVRLQAWRDSGAVTVELLWCGPDAPRPTRLDAVRADGDEREVWRSPHGRCRTADVVRFLYDLLLLDGDVLDRRYLRLG